MANESIASMQPKQNPDDVPSFSDFNVMLLLGVSTSAWVSAGSAGWTFLFVMISTVVIQQASPLSYGTLLALGVAFKEGVDGVSVILVCEQMSYFCVSLNP